MRVRYADFGSVSSGTMRVEDLLDSFASELDYQLKRQVSRFPRKEHRALIREARSCLARIERNGNPHKSKSDLTDPADIVAELFDALEEFAPPYAYFGAHEGDGADYGYWISSDAIEFSFDGLKVDDLSEVPSDYRGEVLHVNDHGNMTLYVANGRRKFREIWGVV